MIIPIFETLSSGFFFIWVECIDQLQYQNLGKFNHQKTRKCQCLNLLPDIKVVGRFWELQLRFHRQRHVSISISSNETNRPSQKKRIMNLSSLTGFGFDLRLWWICTPPAELIPIAELELAHQWTTSRGYSTCSPPREQLYHYRPRREGDNVLGSVRPSVCVRSQG